MSLLVFLIVGLIAGWLAGQVVKGGGFGLVGDLVVGVIGAFLGGFLFNSMGVSGGGGPHWQYRCRHNRRHCSAPVDSSCKKGISAP
jgi:uncharacterized membrane protein YeaQ/YmgE (transglycosylase-associated protein family)